MSAAADLRRIALALPEAYEDVHRRRPAFRVNKRIFAMLGVAGNTSLFPSLGRDDVAVVKLDREDQLNMVAAHAGADQIELSADQCTLFYTSEGPSILRFNVCTGQQLAAFATNLTRALTLRILPDGGVLVTDEKDITRLDASGQKVTTYTVAGEQCWDGLTLDSDRTSFWAADFCSSNIYKFDIATGRQLAKLNPGAASGSTPSAGKPAERRHQRRQPFQRSSSDNRSSAALDRRRSFMRTPGGRRPPA